MWLWRGHENKPGAGVQEVTGSQGEALDGSTRQFMESRFGHDFSRVRIHSDAAAHGSARELHARAYTVGQDIAFAAGEYSPSTAAGRHLLAHELAHVVQQSGGQPTAQIQREDAGPAAPPVVPTPPPLVPPTPAQVPGVTAPATAGSTAEITLETGNNAAWYQCINNEVHQQICVDGYAADAPKRCFSFAAVGAQFPQFSTTWLGWSSWVVNGILQGQVYEAGVVSGASIVNRHSPTPAQATTWLDYMTGTRLGLQDAYSVGRHNCRLFSQWEFRDAPSHW